jgi:hypothetical protein
VVGVPDECHEVAAVRVPARFGVHLGDERADGIDDAQPAPGTVLAHGRRDAVGREDADLPGRHLGLVIHEDRAETLESSHHVVVVDDLMTDVDRWAVLGEQALDDLDRAVDSGTKGARRREEDASTHATASRLFNARRAPTVALAVTTGSRMNPRRKPG